jgi:hypothetical protein
MKKLFLLLFVAITSMVFAQNEMNVTSGSFDFIKGQTEINVQLNFDNTLYQIENLTEKQYLENRKRDILANPEKTEADWQKWYEEWEKYKNTEYLNFFFKGANSKSKVVFKTDSNAKYTLIINAKWIYAGWHGGVVGQEAKLSADLKVVETNNPVKVLMEAKCDRIAGKIMNKNFIMEYGRIAGAFEATGRRFMGKEYKRALRD